MMNYQMNIFQMIYIGKIKFEIYKLFFYNIIIKNECISEYGCSVYDATKHPKKYK